MRCPSFPHPCRPGSPTRSATPHPRRPWDGLPIQRGEHTLILAPTGSGKTLTAFLWGIDDLFRELTGTVATDAADEHSSNGPAEGGGAWSCLPVLAYAADSLAHKESAVVETTTAHGR